MNGQGVLDMIQNSMKAYNGLLQTAADVLLKSPTELHSGAWNAAASIYDTLQGVSYALLVLFFVIGLMRNVSNIKDMSLQTVIGYILRFAISKGILDFGKTLMLSIIKISTGINNLLPSISPPQLTNVLANADLIKQLDFLGALPCFAVAILTMVVLYAFGIALIVVVYMRFFKVYLHFAVAPLFLSTMGGEATQNVTSSYLKSLITVLLEATIIVIALILASHIVGSGLQFGIIDTSTALGVVTDYGLSAIAGAAITTITAFGANRLVHSMIAGG